MDWIDRINERFLSMLGKQKAGTKIEAAAGAALLRLSPASIQQLVHLELTSYDEYIGETFAFFGCLADGSLVAINESDAEWAGVCNALDQSGRLSVLIDTAKLQFLANEERKPLCLLSEAGVHRVQ